MTRLSLNELFQSRLAERQNMPTFQPPATAQFPLVSLVKIVTGEGVAQAWRVTLSRLERQDNLPSAHPGDPGQSGPLYIGQQYPYYFWEQRQSIVPPRRASPIFDALDPVNGADIQPTFVEIAWGMANAKPNRLLAHWPAQGASIVLVGSYVEVWGAGRVIQPTIPGGTPVPNGAFPTFQATITEDKGLPTETAGELSMTTRIGLVEFFAARLVTDGPSNPGAGEGFTAIGSAPTSTSPDSAIRGSAVLNVGPFAGFNAVYAPAAQGRTPKLTVFVQNTGAAVVNVQGIPNKEFLPDGTLIDSPGNQAVRIDTAKAPQATFANLQAQITAGGIFNLVTPSANLAFVISTVATGTFSDVSVIYDPPVGAPGPAEFGFALTAPTFQGATVYVPDFARRVRVVLVTAGNAHPENGPGARIPIAGDPKAQLVFWDDRGQEIDEAFQGPTATGFSSPTWHEVPAQAVLLGIYSDQADPVGYTALIHWRVAP